MLLLPASLLRPTQHNTRSTRAASVPTAYETLRSVLQGFGGRNSAELDLAESLPRKGVLHWFPQPSTISTLKAFFPYSFVQVLLFCPFGSRF